MKIYRTVGIKCPVCGQQRLCVDRIGSKGKGQSRYAVSCMDTAGPDGTVVCRHGVWGEDETEQAALTVALTNMVVHFDTNMKVRVGTCAHIVDSLLKQLKPADLVVSQESQ